MLGQSNMAGRGFLHEVDPIYNEKSKCCGMDSGR